MSEWTIEQNYISILRQSLIPVEIVEKYLLEDIIFIGIVSIICGADDWNEIEMFAKLKINWFRKYSPLANGIPSHDTFNRVFSLLDPKKYTELITKLFSSTILEGLDLISIDGKTVRRLKTVLKENG